MSDWLENVASLRAATMLIITNQEGKILLLKRSGTGWMDGHWGLPGGKVDHGESIKQAAIREAKEEVGIDITKQDLQLALLGHNLSDGNYWMHAIFIVNKYEGTITNAEPHMHSELGWFDIGMLPEPTIATTVGYLNNYKKGNNYAEFGW